MAGTFDKFYDALQASDTGDNQEDLVERLDIVRHKLKFIQDKPLVICIEALEPLTIAGEWLPEAVAIAGGIAVPDSQLLSNDGGQISSADPEIIVIALRGSSIEDTLREISLLLQQPGFANLKAVKNNRLYIADGRRFYDNGPGMVDTVEMLAEMINPKQFIFGYEGGGWIKFSL